MKILIAANNDMGLYKFRKELLQELLKCHEVYILLPEGKLISEMIAMGCKYIPLEFDRHGTNPIKELSLIGSYKKVLKKIEPEVVLTYTIKPNVYCGMVCATMKIPYIANITGLGTAIENGGIMQKLTVALNRYGLRKAKCVFFQNQENRDFFVSENIVKGNDKLIPGSGVNLDEFRVLPYPEDKTINFVFVARIMKEKGIEQYLDAAKYIKAKYPNAIFHICGFCEEAYEGKLNDLQNEGIITYHGVIRNMHEFLKDIHCVVHPTYYAEGMSNVLLEACATGRPVISTDRSGCREIVDDGVNGFICKQRDSEDLIRQLERFLTLSDEEKRQMGLAGREKVEKEFDRKIVVHAYIEEIEKKANEL